MLIESVRYANAGGIDIAYQVFGDGELPVVIVPGAATCVEMVWEFAPIRPWYERWGAFAKVAHFDKRGTGHSERIIGVPSVEQRVEDIHAVMDAAGFEDAAIYGLSEGGPLAMLFAATYPGRVRALVLQGTFARLLAAPDYPIGFREDQFDFLVDAWAANWGTDQTITLEVAAPSMKGRADAIAFAARFERASASPSTLRAILRLAAEIDVRHILPVLSCPSLVFQARQDQLVPHRFGRYLAEHIPGARLHLYDGEHYPVYAAVDEQMDTIEEFLTGHLGSTPADRVLATVLFTDIVDSSATAAASGDTVWRDLLVRHNDVIDREVARHRGRPIKTTGDGVLATFDSPARAIRCAQSCVQSVRGLGLEIRAGLHTGEIELVGDDIAGIAVHLAARVAGKAHAGEVLVSGSVPPLVVGSGLEFVERGTHELKGIPGSWPLLAVAT